MIAPIMTLVLQQQGLQVQKEIAVYFRGSLIGSFRADKIVEEKAICLICVNPWLNNY